LPAVLSGEIGAAGNSDNSYHVVSGVTCATLDGFVVTAGNADGNSSLAQVVAAGCTIFLQKQKPTRVIAMEAFA
jgi:hypothetical protein